MWLSGVGCGQWGNMKLCWKAVFYVCVFPVGVGVGVGSAWWSVPVVVLGFCVAFRVAVVVGTLHGSSTERIQSGASDSDGGEQGQRTTALGCVKRWEVELCSESH